MYKVFLTKRATKALRKIPHEYQTNLKDVIHKLRENPFKLDLKKLDLPHQTSHRLRLGAYRIFLDVDTNTKEIIIADIIRRTTRTYR